MNSNHFSSRFCFCY